VRALGAAAAMMALLAAACGPSLTFSDFRHQENQIECDVIFRCCTQAVQALYGADTAACAKTLDGRIDTSFAEMEIAKGHSRFDAGAAASCLSAERTALTNCDDPLPPRKPDPCPTVLTGTIADQGTCDQRIPECVPGEFCIATNPAPAPGLCTRESQEGESCLDVACVDGLACASTGTCIQPLADGLACIIAAECASGNCVGMICAPISTVRVTVCR
jgi:hypothetical protein